MSCRRGPCWRKRTSRSRRSARTVGFGSVESFRVSSSDTRGRTCPLPGDLRPTGRLTVHATVEHTTAATPLRPGVCGQRHHGVPMTVNPVRTPVSHPDLPQAQRIHRSRQATGRNARGRELVQRPASISAAEASVPYPPTCLAGLPNAATAPMASPPSASACRAFQIQHHEHDVFGKKNRRLGKKTASSSPRVVANVSSSPRPSTDRTTCPTMTKLVGEVGDWSEQPFVCTRRRGP